MSDLERLRAVPELYRARAQTTASLATTAAAVISAGIAFGSAKLSTAAELLATGSILFLLVSVCYSVAASQFSDEQDVPTAELVDEIKRITGRIRRLTRRSSYAGIVAMVMFIGLVVAVLFDDTESTPIEAHFDTEIMPFLTSQCPAIGSGPVRATVDQSLLADPTQPLEFAISQEECGTNIGTVIIDRSHVELVVEVSSGQ